MVRRTFKGYVPTEVQTIELQSADGTKSIEVKGKPAVAGSVILDFLAKIDTDEPGTLAQAVNEMLRLSIDEESWDDFKAFIDDDSNGITLDILSEIAGFFAESFSGKAEAPSAPSMAS
jgi:hypothetical protein